MNVRVAPSEVAPDLRTVSTRDIQWELEKREGVQAKRLGIDAKVEVVIDGQLWAAERGPLTVSINQD